ncbi:MAG: PD-(D/E)XK motif protein [Deltaproteobacteria bacterium]
MSKPTRTELRQAIEVSLEILGSPSTNDALSVRELEAVSTAHGPALVGIDATNSPHLLLAVDASRPAVETRPGSSVSARRRELRHSGDLQVFIDVACHVPRLSRLFMLLCTDLLERVSQARDDPDAIVGKTLEEWRSLVARAQSKLDESTARGLFGELHQLEYLLDIDSGALRCWHGPEGADHDLFAGSTALEVKSLGRRGAIIEIHGVRQLEPPTGGELVLCVQTVETRTDGDSLGMMVERVQDRTSNRSLFSDRLALLGLEEGEPQLETYRFVVTEERYFRVEDGFPRLVPSDLVGGSLHPAIRNLKYVVDLSSANTGIDVDEAHSFRKRMLTC